MLMKSPLYPNPPSGRAPERAPDWILRRQKLAVAKKYFRGSLPWFQIFQGFIGGKSRAKEPRGAHNPARRPQAAARGLVASLGTLCLGSQAPCVSSVPEKIFSEVLFRLDSV